MRPLIRSAAVAVVFVVATLFAVLFGSGRLLRGIEAAGAVPVAGKTRAPYDLTQLGAVNETLKLVKEKYVDPTRVKPRQMFLSALNQVQKEVAPVIVLHETKAATVTVRVHDKEQSFRVDNVVGIWDVSARLREVFTFLQAHLDPETVDLREVEYAACNGMLRTLDPHSVFMSPEAYREMNLNTSGKFGGLGIVIAIRDQLLTVMRPMPGTPAGRAKLKRFDRIKKINNESTVNMPLDDAVSRLRGDPGTKVTIWVHRDGPDGWDGERPFTLEREQIRIASVESQDLGQRIGYVRLKQFQASTTAELDRALAKLQETAPLEGLVLDLRGNPGGLLDQAAKVADKFIEEGTIVATVGHSEGREEKAAARAGTEPNYPIVVLTSPNSASASEIVAGALKAQQRAVIVGQTTFGKGTVQLVFPRVTPENAALKLTIAQYLTPGDVSIQGVGVTPDVELDPMTADLQEMDLFRTDELLRERDLSKSLTGAASHSSERPFFRLRYRLPTDERLELRERGSDPDDELRVDFPIAFARTLLGKLPRAPRKAALAKVTAVLSKAQDEQDKAIASDLEKLGIDWSAPADPKAVTAAADFEVTVKSDRPGNEVLAGESLSLEVTVKNKGKVAAHQLRATTKSDSPYFDERELVFGKLDAGATKTVVVPLGWCEVEGRKLGSSAPIPKNPRRNCSLPKRSIARQDPVRVKFSVAQGEPPADAEIRPTVKSLPQPIFAYTYQLADDRPGDGDGQLSRGEGATVYLTVKNVGPGASHETQANLRNLTGDGLLLRNGRFDISNMKPGESRTVQFSFDVLPELAQGFVKLQLSVIDADLQVVSTEKLTIPVTAPGAKLPLQPVQLQVAPASAPAPLFARPMAGATPFARLAATSVVSAVAEHAGFYKVKLGGERFAFVQKDAVRAQAGAESVTLDPLLSHSPPLLEVKPGPLAVRTPTTTLEGVARDADRVLDVYVFVGARKVFYRSGRQVADSRELPFKIDAQLQPGVNVITVVARENDVTVTRTTRIVRRDGPQGEVLPTPKNELYGLDSDAFGE